MLAPLPVREWSAAIQLRPTKGGSPQIVQDVKLVLDTDGRGSDVDTFKGDVDLASFAVAVQGGRIRRPQRVVVLGVFEVDRLVDGGEGTCGRSWPSAQQLGEG